MMARKLVLIDDDSQFTYLLQRFAVINGFEVTSLLPDANAFTAVQREQPSIIVLNALMPVTNGWDVLSQLKADPITRRIPVIVCSTVEEVERANHANADYTLWKPITLVDFTNALVEVGISVTTEL
jgi:CheY-like chemotaxis protein